MKLITWYIFFYHLTYFNKTHSFEIENQIKEFKKKFSLIDDPVFSKNFSIKKCDEKNICFSKSVSNSILFAAKSRESNFEENLKPRQPKNKRSMKKNKTILFILH